MLKKTVVILAMMGMMAMGPAKKPCCASSKGKACAEPKVQETGGVTIDQRMPVYEPIAGLSGDLKSIGSDTMVNVMGYWVESFNKAYPAVRVQVEGKGSSTAPPALIENQSQFGPMSRAMDPEEVDAFVERYGYEPTALRVAVDCVAVYVNKDCPVDEISLEQVEAVFSVSGKDHTWGDLGVSDPSWASRPVALYGRNSASGTYKFFKKVGMGKQDYKATVKEAPGSAGVISGIASDPYAMGYSGVGYKTPDVKLLKVAYANGEDAFAPSQINAMSGEYPLARFLYMYMNHDPRKGLDDLRGEFVKMVYSKQGQEAVVKDGAYPVSAELASEELDRVGMPNEALAAAVEADNGG